MERVAGENIGQETTSMKKVAFASFIGTAYTTAMATVSFACVFLLSETYLTDLSEIRSEAHHLLAEAQESAAG